MTLPAFPNAPRPETPRLPIPPEVSAGAFPAGGMLACILAAGLIGALFFSSKNDMFYVRDQLFAIAGACAVLLGVVALVWVARAAKAKALYRDGTLVQSVVTRRVDVRYKGSLGYDTTVRYQAPDGRFREATFRLVNQVVPDPKILVLGERVGLHLTAYQMGPVVVSAVFRDAVARPSA